MFTKKVTDDDSFMALSSSAQALYLHLAMSADDDGFSNQVSISMFKAHASVQDLQTLLEKRYIYQFENGVIVIKHWRMANALRKDRYTPTAFQEELAQLDLKENGSYTRSPGTTANHLATKWQPDGNQMAPQNSIDKISLVEDKKEKKPAAPRFSPPTVEEVRTYCTERKNAVDPEAFVDFYASKGWKVGSQSMKDWKAAVRTWEKRDAERAKTKQEQKSSGSFYRMEEHGRAAEEDKAIEQALLRKGRKI